MINLITNEVYIGYSVNLENRYKNYKNNQVKTQPLIHQSIHKYGFSNHKFDVLFSFEEDPKTNTLKQFENIFIRYYKYWKGCNMLNTNEGGGGSSKWSEEKKKQKSHLSRGTHKLPILQYDLVGKFIRKWESISVVSRELKLDYNLLIRCLKADSNRFSVGGYQWKYDKNHKPILIGQYDLNDNFIRNWTNASEFLRSINKSTASSIDILNVCKGKYKTRYGYKWKFIHPSTEQTIYNDIEAYDDTSNTAKPILQYSLDGIFIREWTSTVEACQELKITKQSVFNSLHNRPNKLFTRKELEYQWRFKTNNYPKEIEKFAFPVVVQYTMDGKYIRTWENIITAARELKLSKSGINHCINFQMKSSAGFQWRRVKSDNISMKIESAYPKIVLNEETEIKLHQYGMDGKYIRSWDHPCQVTRDLGIDSGSIKSNVKGYLKSAGKYRWRYGLSSEKNDLSPLRIVCQYDMDGNLIKEWASQKEIAENSDFRTSGISNNINGRINHAYGFVWSYKK